MQDGLYRRGKIWYFGWRGPSGLRRDFSTGTANYARAKQNRAKRIAEMKAGTLPAEIERLKFADAADAWLKAAVLSMAANTQRNARSRLRALRRTFGGMTVGDIMAHEIQAYAPARKIQNLKIQNSTINSELLTLRAILKHASAWTPFHAEAFKPLRVQARTSRRPLTEDEQRRLTARASPWMKNIIILALHTGLRSGEVKGLRLGDLHFDAPLKPVLSIRRATTKTESGERRVMLDRAASGVVRQMLDLAYMAGARRDDEYLIPMRLRSGKYDPTRPIRSWAHTWKKVCRVARLPGIHFHDLRHTYITTGAEAGVPLETMRRQVGHISEAQTRYYTQVRDTAMAEAVDQIEQYTERGESKSGILK